MAIASSVHLILKGLLASQTIQNAFIWFSDGEHPSINGGDIVSAFYSDVWSDLKNLLADDFLLMELVGWYSDFTIGPKPEYTQVVNEPGTVSASDALPPFCTVVIKKLPDNTTKFPSGNADFSPGFVGFGGAPESCQDNGLLAPTPLSDWDSLGETLETLSVNAGGTPQDYTLGMYRHSPVVSERTYVMCAETYASQKVGTRNSRKR